MTLKQKAVGALFWSFSQGLGQQSVRFAISIVMARLLLPAEFGLVGMVAVFIALGELLINSGFAKALIQRKDPTHLDFCTIFYFNLAAGFACSLLLFLAAPWVAAFYHSPNLVPLTRVMSLNFIFTACGLIQCTLLTRRLDFKRQMKVTMSAGIVSGGIGIVMAYRGFGVWSIVTQNLVANVLTTILYWMFQDWRPSLIFSLNSLRSMFGYGSKLLLSRIIDTVVSNIYLVVIGRVFAAAELAFYWRADQIQQLPSTNLCQASERVMFPVFSSLQDDPPRLKRALRKALTGLAMFSLPMTVGVAVAARPFILTLLGSKWLPSVPLLQLLCVAGALYPLHFVNLSVLAAQGRSDLFLNLEIFKKAITVISVCITFRFGIRAMIYGQIAVSGISYSANIYYTAKLLAYPIIEQVGDVLPYLGAALLMGVCEFAVHWLPFTKAPAILALQIAVGVAVYALVCFTFRLKASREGLNLILEMKAKRRSL
ncbi:MAG TPA: lipopolysaccharide biosynthesis protein [Candidatus Saccharimonadales bacterium]|nr:lipopolysaccharide biosynthesis protein [Candidatus Saccharimonadales bacterium]